MKASKPGLTPEQIRKRHPFLNEQDEVYIPVTTIQAWLDGAPVASSPRDAPSLNFASSTQAAAHQTPLSHAQPATIVTPQTAGSAWHSFTLRPALSRRTETLDTPDAAGPPLRITRLRFSGRR